MVALLRRRETITANGLSLFNSLGTRRRTTTIAVGPAPVAVAPVAAASAAAASSSAWAVTNRWVSSRDQGRAQFPGVGYLTFAGAWPAGTMRSTVTDRPS
ncbi:hypothetical protein [Actinoplanes sp. NPDC049265]|uniref:hypothetical protein n=1 Tax=Actinoplanes sp. NPDC049265 TaxID=3363902 RepID=UPI003721AF48